MSDDKDNSQSEPCQVNTSRCSNIEMMKAVIYPGDITKQGMNSESSIVLKVNVHEDGEFYFYFINQFYLGGAGVFYKDCLSVIFLTSEI